jgi:hypothetical protein
VLEDRRTEQHDCRVGVLRIGDDLEQGRSSSGGARLKSRIEPF